jgi:hypothetical protein
MGLERPEADAVEQSQDITPDEEEPDEYEVRGEVPLEADEADAVEQERAVAPDDDDYR